MSISGENGRFNSPTLALRPESQKSRLYWVRKSKRTAATGEPPEAPKNSSLDRTAARPRQDFEFQRQKLRTVVTWTKLSERSGLPTLGEARSADPALLSPLSAVFDLEPQRNNPVISFLGRKFGRLSEMSPVSDGPEGSASSRLLSLIFDQSAEAIISQAPHEFAAKWQDRSGNIFQIAGFALPFSKDGVRVDQVLASIAIVELVHAAGESRDGTQDSADDELLLDQELEPAGKPQLAVQAQDLPFILVSLPGAADSVRQEQSREPDRTSGLQLTGGDQARPAGDDLELSVGPLTARLMAARNLADAAKVSEARSHGALYAAISGAYDLAIAASEAPEECNQMLRAANITVVPRAPMTGIVKLVFGSDYDKTRITEYAAALAYASRNGLESGKLADLLHNSDGGLKNIVQEERRLRRVEQGTTRTERTEPRAALARMLRSLPALTLSELPTTGDEFMLVLAHRSDGGTPVLIGEIPRDVALLERAARKLVASQD